MEKKKQGKNLEDIQEMNRSLIIRLMRKKTVCSRAELTQASGLNQSTITNIINELINWGLVVETGMIEGKKGRRSIGITLNGEGFKVIGIRLTRKSVVVGLYDISGKEYAKQHISIGVDEGSISAFKKFKKLVRDMIQLYENEIVAIGVATPGPFLKYEGRVALMSNFLGWEKINLQEELMREFNMPVYVEHDANAGAFAHWWFGSKHLEEGVMMYITAGQGVGAGIISNGTIFQGALGMAGEIGHTSIDYEGPVCECGHRGCLELYCSSSAILKKFGHEVESIKTVIKNLSERDVKTENVIKEAAWYLGFGLVNVVNAFNPNHIVIGDELSDVGEPLLNGVREVLKSNLLPETSSQLSIELTTIKDDILIGAVSIAIDYLLQEPSKYFSKTAI